MTSSAKGRISVISPSLCAAAILFLALPPLANAVGLFQWRGQVFDEQLATVFHPQGQEVPTQDDGSFLVVLGFKLTKSRKTIPKTDSTVAAPAAAVTRDDINYEKSKRANDPVGTPDPRSYSVDARSAALEKIVQESRSSGSKTIDGFEHRIKVRNAGTKVVEVLFWEYQLIESLNPANVMRRQFICGVEMKPKKEMEVQAFSVSNPGAVISVDTLAKSPDKPFEERVVINRVEYKDGSIWQRKDWKFAEVRSAIARAVSTPWGAEMCRSL
ncbi:MAG TPA: hypothetical protein VFH15_06270 [Pyrinomonadaceae bacterium]|nr:hypothetical protein [Pyrinomonadaceae bacterium]